MKVMILVGMVLGLSTPLMAVERVSSNPIVLRTMEDRIQFIDGLWQAYKSDEGLSKEDERRVHKIKLYQFPHAEALKLTLMKSALKVEVTADEVAYMSGPGSWGEKSLQFLAEHEEEFDQAYIEHNILDFSKQKSVGRKENIDTNDNWTKDDIRELIDFRPKWRFGNNDYRKVTNLFVFCRENRNFPCLMLMKDKDGNLVRKENGEVWTQKKLALSGRGLSYDQSNGNTPQGLFTIDSVMPKADRRLVYGKYRRIMLDFVASSRNEKDYLHYIPDELQSMNWWRESVIARDNGRSLFRIHGVGVKNLFSNSPYYPFIPTAGCIASIEGKYKGVVYKDQRELLDQFMISMGLAPTYENETKIKGLLYVVNINDEERAVELEDIL